MELVNLTETCSARVRYPRPLKQLQGPFQRAVVNQHEKHEGSCNNKSGEAHSRQGKANSMLEK